MELPCDCDGEVVTQMIYNDPDTSTGGIAIHVDCRHVCSECGGEAVYTDQQTRTYGSDV